MYVQTLCPKRAGIPGPVGDAKHLLAMRLIELEICTAKGVHSSGVSTILSLVFLGIINYIAGFGHKHETKSLTSSRKICAAS